MQQQLKEITPSHHHPRPELHTSRAFSSLSLFLTLSQSNLKGL
jgi:hypothetical protein